MSTRKIKDAKDLSTDELIYFKGHAKATYMSDGTTVEDAINNIEVTGGSNVTETTVTLWGFTKNEGTVTGITMNGVSKGTSGVIDLGTVITAHLDISSKQDKLTSGTNIKTINGTSILGSGNITINGSNNAADINVADSSNIFDNTNVESVLSELASMWEWDDR